MLYKEDCFTRCKTSNNATFCSAIEAKTCKDCHFYRNDVTKEEIEKDIKNYYLGKGAKK